MYTEIKELVNFMAQYYLGRIPRRRVGLFLEEYANNLVSRFSEMWDLTNPKKDEQHRMIRLRMNGVVDQMLLTVAHAMMVDLDVVTMCTPDNVTVYVNPGEVYFKCGEFGTACPIWVGDVNEDDRYMCLPSYVTNSTNAKPAGGSMMGAAGKTALVGKTTANGISVGNEVDDPWVALHLEEVHPALFDNIAAKAFKTRKRLAHYPKDHKPYTVEQFAQTRFGSNRVRPDHDALRKIQEQAAVKTNVKNEAVPGDATPPTVRSPVPSTSTAMELLSCMPFEDRANLLKFLATLQASTTSSPTGSCSSGDSKSSSTSPTPDESCQYWNNAIW